MLDHSGCIFDHGSPEIERKWSLAGRQKKERVTPVRQCPACFCAHPPAPVCPECGYRYPLADRGAPEEVDDELEEVDLRQAEGAWKKRQEQIAKKAEQGRAKTLEQLIELGRSRGYNHPVGWAQKIMASRHF